MNIKQYFNHINNLVSKAYSVAEEARRKGWDPEDHVAIPIAKNKAERCVNLVGSLAPEILNKSIPRRIHELEEKYGVGDFRVAMTIAYEVASEKFCKFDSKEKALEVGIRLGIAYITLGTVSAPLEGFVELKFKKTKNNKDYISIFFAGPIRAAGGTAAAVSVLISDYLRYKFNYAKYDPTPEEINRYIYEINDYDSRVSRLQYKATEEEIKFLITHIGVELNGDPTTDFDVSNGKGLPRVETNKIRGGMCLVLSEGLAQKAKKIWKKLKSWGDFFEEWSWLKDLIEIQKKIWEKSTSKEDEKITPSYKYMHDAVAGRPIFSYPLRKGGFRLRYGRTRFSGYECLGFNPAVMPIVDNFMSIGTQLKVERPGKGCTVTPCEYIDGPIVRLKNGDVVKVNSFEEAKELAPQVEKIIFLGDMLVNYGAFREHGHKLIPGAYVPERWVLELKEKAPQDDPRIKELVNNPFTVKPSFSEAVELSRKYNIPLHPDYLFYYDVPLEDLKKLSSVLSKEIPIEYKGILESMWVPHKVSGDKLIISNEDYEKLSFVLKNINNVDGKDVFEILSKSAGVEIKNIAPIFIGARMGRPEKAKHRKLLGSPNVMFPCGQEGGRLRSFNAALEVGFVEAEFKLYFCEKCQRETVAKFCEVCGSQTVERYVCVKCKRHVNTPTHCSTKCKEFDKIKIDIKLLINSALKRLGMNMPPLVKGIRGTSNKLHIPEPIEKGILRAKHGLCVNKDATIRLDFTELSLTHFKPCEIGTSVEKLRELGYDKDIYGNPLEREDQICELKPQDVIIGDSKDFPDADMGRYLLKISNFVDELLVKLYGLNPYYNAKTKEDLIGKLVICLAPHTSAGVIGRIIGFSKIQALIAHPYMHAAVRRDCDGDEVGIMLLLDALINFSRQYLPNKRGSRSMDAPLVLTTNISPEEVDDEVYDFDRAWVYPLEFYRAADEFKNPNEVSIPVVSDFLGKEEQFYGFGFTHPVDNINTGVRATAYKTLQTMMDKLLAEMDLASKTLAVDDSDVATLIINKHFLRDIKGNLRKYSEQSFRCVNCNSKYRRIPLIGKCPKCGGKLLLTVHEGTVIKYLEPSIHLAEKHNVNNYIRQTLEVIQERIKGMFGWETEKQSSLSSFL